MVIDNAKVLTGVEPSGVCITGLGAISCAGVDVESLWQAALQLRVSAEWFEEPVMGQRIACCRVPQSLPKPRGMRAVDFQRLDRFAQLGVVAGQQAWDDAGLPVRTLDPRRIAIVTGTSRGPMGQSGSASAASATGGASTKERRVRPTASVYGSAASLSGALAMLTGARGPSLTVSATCASSSSALGVAALQIVSGACDVALVGGADAPLRPQFLAELLATGVLGTGDDPARVCRPYDRGRTGITIGEAGAYLVLESPQHARERGVPVRAELIGWASACDPGRRSGMSEGACGVQDALEAALAWAHIEVEQIDAVHVHGTGTPVGDAAEGQVLRQMFGGRAGAVPFTSSKPVTGHCLGASGALQVVLNVRALEEQCLPPTSAGGEPDPDCGIELLRNTPWRGVLRTILTHSAGFWGNHAGMVFRRGDSLAARLR